MSGAFIVGAMGIGLAVLSAWLRINNKDGSGWAVLAFILIVTSCSKAGG